MCSELDEPISEQETGEGIENDDAGIFKALLVSAKSVLEPDHAGGDKELEKIDIFSVHVKFESTKNEFWGAYIDSGRKRTVLKSAFALAK